MNKMVDNYQNKSKKSNHKNYDLNQRFYDEEWRKDSHENARTIRRKIEDSEDDFFERKRKLRG